MELGGVNEVVEKGESLGLFGLSLMRLQSKQRRLWNVSYLITICIIVKCRSFRVLTKALLFYGSTHCFQFNMSCDIMPIHKYNN